MAKLDLIQNQLWDSMRTGKPIAEVLEINPHLRGSVVDSLADQLVKYKPSAVIAVPERADSIAQELAMELGVLWIETKITDNHNVDFRTTANRRLAESGIGRMVIVDAEFKNKTNINKVSKLSGIGRKVIAAAAVWRPGDTTKPHGLPFPLVTIINGKNPKLVEKL